MPASNVVVNAKFSQIVYTVKCTSGGNGSVRADKSENLTPGEIISLTVTPSSGYEIDTLIAKDSNGEEIVINNDYTFTFPKSNVTVDATFKKAEKTYSITISSVKGGNVATRPASATSKGSTVIIDITPDDKYIFVEGSLSVKDVNGDDVPLSDANTFIMPESNVTISAEFTGIYSVTIEKSEYGTVTADKTSDITKDTTITLRVTPEEGFVLGTLTVVDENGVNASVNDDDYTFVMPDSDVTITAVFKKYAADLTADEAAEAITKMTESGSICVVGEITSAQLGTIVSAITQLPNTDILVDLDLSKTTGLSYVGGFEGSKNLASITFPDSITTIGSFRNCTSLKSISIPDGVDNMEEYTFAGCSSLESIVLPSKLWLINSYFFMNCTSLTSVTIPESVFIIHSGAFKGCSALKSLIILGSVTNISSYETFDGCVSFSSVTISEGATEIPENAFKDCTFLSSVSLPDSLITIKTKAFQNCTNLKEIIIPKNVTTIEGGAFQDCKLETITFCSPEGWYLGDGEIAYNLETEQENIDLLHIINYTKLTRKTQEE